jgi:hypothetical protein
VAFARVGVRARDLVLLVPGAVVAGETTTGTVLWDRSVVRVKCLSRMEECYTFVYL